MRARSSVYRVASGFLLAALAACGPTEKAGAPAVDPRITRALQGVRPRVAIKGEPPVRWTLAERMALHHVPGVSIAVIDSGRIIWAGGFGVKEAGTNDSVTATTLFQAASISKPVTASAMLQLVEAGKLSLDENVNTYLKSWKVPDNKFTAKEKVTLRRIVSHSAGLTIHGFPGYAVTDPLPTLVQVLDGVKPPANTDPVRVDTFPGAIYRYSGGGTTIEQQLLLDVTGTPFPTFMKSMVLDKVGMSSSTYEQPLPESRWKEASSAHLRDGSVVKGKWHVYPEMAAAGLWTTPTDLAKWAIAIADARAGRSTKLLSKEMATQMLTVQKAPLGLGPFLGGEGRSFQFGHSGGNEGFICNLVMFPETGQGIAVMTNSFGGPELLAEVQTAFAEEFGWPAMGQQEKTVATVDSARLQSLAGKYEVQGERPITMTVTVEDGHLMMEAPPFFPKIAFYPESPTEFFSRNDNKLAFTVNQKGVGTAVEIGGMKATRK